MNVTARILPRRSRRDSRASSCVVSVNGAAGPILERCWAPLASWPGARPGAASVASATRRTTYRTASRLTSALQLLLELVDEPPVGAVRDDLLGIRLDDSRFVQAQRVEPHSILDFILAPPAVWNLLHRLERVVVALREATLHDDAGGALGFQCADLVGLHDRPQGALGCHRVLVDKVVVGHHPTAEVL